MKYLRPILLTLLAVGASPAGMLVYVGARSNGPWLMMWGIAAFAALVLGILMMRATLLGENLGRRLATPQAGDKIVSIGGPWDCVRILQERGLFADYSPITRLNAAIIRRNPDGTESLFRTELVEESFADPVTIHNVTHGENFYVNEGGKVVKGDLPHGLRVAPRADRRLAV